MKTLMKTIQDCAKEVYRVLEAGYSESIYEEAMCVELKNREIDYEVQHTVEVFYKEKKVGTHRLDLIVRNSIVVELKAASTISKSNKAQLRSYLITLKKEGKIKKGLGILINFPYPYDVAEEKMFEEVDIDILD